MLFLKGESVSKVRYPTLDAGYSERKVIIITGGSQVKPAMTKSLRGLLRQPLFFVSPFEISD